MDMTGERRIAAPRQVVWDALNDPAVLRAAIPGCKTLEKTSDTDMRATAAVRIGPISASFNGKVQLLDLDPPNSYRIAGEGQGGVAGFANGGANVRLADDGAGTLLSYDVKAQVGGKIAQLGARLIDATAKQMADQFFDKFSAEVSTMSQSIAAPQAAAAPQPVAAPGATHVPGHVPEFGADGTLAGGAEAIRAATHTPAGISIFSLIPKEPYGFPLVFWIGSVIFLFILFLVFGSLIF